MEEEEVVALSPRKIGYQGGGNADVAAAADAEEEEEEMEGLNLVRRMGEGRRRRSPNGGNTTQVRGSCNKRRGGGEDRTLSHCFAPVPNLKEKAKCFLLKDRWVAAVDKKYLSPAGKNTALLPPTPF